MWKKLLLIACVAGLALTSLSPVEAKTNRRAAVIQEQSPGPLVCGFIWNWHAPCNRADIIVGSTIYGAALGLGVGAVIGAGSGVAGGVWSASWSGGATTAGLWTATGAGAVTGFVVPAVIVH